ncbi:MAG TPA: amidohydrolase family protein [Pyrinomonadaceae bacterium]|jgi:beta-aspartyl-dipeptidase (metallo-type)
MLTLIENGEIHAPEPLGKGSILCARNMILKIGDISRAAVEAVGVECEIVDAAGCLVTPGLIDPHQHLLGGSGESGFSTQTPEIHAAEIVAAGITTVVGCLGVDTTMKTLPGLLAKVKALKEEGLSAYMWTGGYNVPPTTVTKDARDDILFIEEVVGAGEIAISDERSTEPDFHELAHLVHDTYVGGMLSRKSGRTHFHVGKGPRRLALLRDLIEKDDVAPDWLYPTHINRSEELMLEAIALAARGSFVDIDTVNEDLPQWLRFYKGNGGDLTKLTVSSDSSITSPQNLFRQIRECVVKHEFGLEEALPLVTANTAQALKLGNKGVLKEGNAADVLILDKEKFEIRDVFSAGKRLLADGKPTFKEAFLKDSNRNVKLKGEKA